MNDLPPRNAGQKKKEKRKGASVLRFSLQKREIRRKEKKMKIATEAKRKGSCPIYGQKSAIFEREF